MTHEERREILWEAMDAITRVPRRNTKKWLGLFPLNGWERAPLIDKDDAWKAVDALIDSPCRLRERQY